MKLLRKWKRQGISQVEETPIVKDDKLSKKQAAVLDYIYAYSREDRPITDTQLVEGYPGFAQRHKYPEQSESGLRTRRHELTVLGYVSIVDKKGLSNTGRQCMRYHVVSLVPTKN